MSGCDCVSGLSTDTAGDVRTTGWLSQGAVSGARPTGHLYAPLVRSSRVITS